jgi:hypothetical protein
MLKIAHRDPGAECALGDQHRALLKTRSFRCFEKMVGTSAAIDADSAHVVARRVLRVLKVPQPALKRRSYACGQALKFYHPTNSDDGCTRAMQILRHGEAQLSGHDAAAANFIFPHTPEAWNAFRSYAGCPFVVIDLSEYLWNEHRPKRKHSRWFGGINVSALAFPHMMPNCHALKPAFPCNGTWERVCPGSITQVRETLLHKDCNRAERPAMCRWHQAVSAGKVAKAELTNC